MQFGSNNNMGGTAISNGGGYSASIPDTAATTLQ